MTIQPEATTDHQTVIGGDIHPEIPMPNWATDRYLDDEGRAICDERSVQHGMFSVEFYRTVSLGADDYPDAYAGLPRQNWLPSIIAATSTTRYHAENVSVRWDNRWPGEHGVDPEYFTLLIADIPAMIETLQLAQRMHHEATRTVRRSADVEEQLREREQ